MSHVLLYVVLDAQQTVTIQYVAYSLHKESLAQCTCAVTNMTRGLNCNEFP
jgi:hypothetical protein